MLTVRPALAIVDVTGPACAGWDVARWLDQTTDLLAEVKSRLARPTTHYGV
jgi:hypothetical protein